MTPQWPERGFLDQSWKWKNRYVRYRALDGLDVSIDGLDIPLFFILDIFAESILAFVEIVTQLSFKRLLSIKRSLLIS